MRLLIKKKSDQDACYSHLVQYHYNKSDDCFTLAITALFVCMRTNPNRQVKQTFEPHLRPFTFLRHEIQPRMKKQAACSQKKEKIPDAFFCCLMGLKSTFSLARLQTTITRFNKSGLSYVNTHREMSSSEG